MGTDALNDAREVLAAAAWEEKCRACGSFHHALVGVTALGADVTGPRAVAQPRRVECRGCEPCPPAEALAALVEAGHGDPLGQACLSDTAAPRAGWPPLPGDYRVLRWRAPVAVCTLCDEALMDLVARHAGPEVAIVGMLSTENLGIERIVRNVTANPVLRRLIVCGADTRSEVGHRPGASLLAFAANGVDGDRRIVGAPGKRPILRNVPALLLDRFRKNVEVVDLIGVPDLGRILGAVAAALPAAAPAPAPVPALPRLPGWLPPATTPDPAGWFVIHVDRSRGLLLLEHYRTDGALTVVVEGRTAPECYIPAVERGLVTRLDHAAYLGKELTRAERALWSGERFVQDSAPEARAGRGS